MYTLLCLSAGLILPYCAVNAPRKKDRFVIVAERLLFRDFGTNSSRAVRPSILTTMAPAVAVEPLARTRLAAFFRIPFKGVFFLRQFMVNSRIINEVDSSITTTISTTSNSRLRLPSPNAVSKFLSCGNQQKRGAK